MTQDTYDDYVQLEALATGVSQAAEGHLAQPEYQHFGACIQNAAQQLEIAHLGWRQYKQAEPDGDANHLGDKLWLLRLTALNLVSRCVVTTLDLCTNALCIRKGYSPDAPQPEGRAFLDVQEKERVTEWLTAEHLDRDWWNTVRGSHHWNILLECRHVVTHRYAPQSVMIGGSSPGASIRIGGKEHLINDLGPRFLQFGFGRFRACCEVLDA